MGYFGGSQDAEEYRLAQLEREADKASAAKKERDFLSFKECGCRYGDGCCD